METYTKQSDNELKVEKSREPMVNTFSLEIIIENKTYWDNLYTEAMQLGLKTKEELE